MPSRLAAFSFALLLARPVLACSVCGCDPAALTVGLDRPSRGALRLSVEDRYLVKESGEGAAFEGERENRMSLRTQFAVARNLVLQADLPFYLWRDHRGASGATDDLARGLGDVAIGARYELLRAGGFVPRHVLSLLVSIGLPTGANDRYGGDDPHLQLGSGAFSPWAGLWYTFGDHPWTWYAGSVARVNGTSGHGFHYGNVITATAGVRRAFLDERFMLSVEAQARNAGYDRAASTGTDPDSGGFLGYSTFGAAIAIGSNLLARVELQIPLLARLHGAQSEHPVGFAGLSWDFAL